MFRRLESGTLRIWFDDQPLTARDGESIATALLAHGIRITRATAVSGAARGPYCMMGACFDCLAEVDGRTGVQTCLTTVRDGMRVKWQDGARAIDTEHA